MRRWATRSRPPLTESTGDETRARDVVWNLQRALVDTALPPSSPSDTPNGGPAHGE